MKKIFLLNILIILFNLFMVSPSHAEIKIKKISGITYIENATTKELEEVFKQHKYLRFRALDNNEYPAIFLKTLPLDYSEISSQKYRNELFIRILTPLALKINEEIENERNQLLLIEKSFNQNNTLTEQELEKLEFLSKKYDYFTRSKDNNRIYKNKKNYEWNGNTFQRLCVLESKKYLKEVEHD